MRKITKAIMIIVCACSISGVVALTAEAGSKVSCSDIDKRINDALKDRWPKVKKPSSFWGIKIAPPVPSQWPAAKGGDVKFIAYGMAFDPNISDGSRIAAPWAVITIDPADPSKFNVEQLADRLKEIGIQGVRPLKQQETEIISKGVAAEDNMLTAIADKKDVSGDALKVVKEYYCLFKKTNGVIYNELLSYGPDFFKSLSCGK